MTWVARTKNDQLKGRDNSVRDVYQEAQLACGHEAKGAPTLSNPDRWFCGECRAFAGAKGARRRAA